MIETDLQVYTPSGCAEAKSTGERLAKSFNTLATPQEPNERRNAIDQARAQLNVEKPRHCGLDLIEEGGRIVVTCSKSVDLCGYKSQTDGNFHPHQDRSL